MAPATSYPIQKDKMVERAAVAETVSGIAAEKSPVSVECSAQCACACTLVAHHTVAAVEEPHVETWSKMSVPASLAEVNDLEAWAAPSADKLMATSWQV